MLTKDSRHFREEKLAFLPSRHAHVIRRRDRQRQDPLQNVREIDSDLRRFLRFFGRLCRGFIPGFLFVGFLFRVFLCQVLSRRACFPVPSPRRSRAESAKATPSAARRRTRCSVTGCWSLDMSSPAAAQSRVGARSEIDVLPILVESGVTAIAHSVRDLRALAGS